MKLLYYRFRWTVVTLIGCVYVLLAPLAFRKGRR